MNPRQRRGALLTTVAVLMALGLVVGVANYVGAVQEQLGPTQSVLILTADVSPLDPIPGNAVEVAEIPQRYVPTGALRSVDELGGFVAATALPTGTMLQNGSVRTPPQIETDEREVAILVSPETGVGGKIQAGDIVDIYATFPPSGEEAARAELVLQAVPIVEIAPAVQTSSEDSGFATEAAVPVTFALSADDVLILAYAESFASEVRLGLRRATDTGELPTERRRYQPPGGTTAGLGD